MTRDTLFATATLIGLIVGAGIFGLPFAVAEAGFFIGILYILVFGGIITLVHLAYGEVVLRTPEKRRLVGYGSLYLGSWVKPVIFLSSVFGLEGALLAYTILGGRFLAALAQPFFGHSPEFWSILFFSAGALVVWRGLTILGKLEVVLDVIFIGALVVLMGFALRFMTIAHLTYVTVSARGFFLPFGVGLFALSGWAAVPELREFFPRNGRLLKRTILLGSLIPVGITLLFVTGVVGVTGAATTPDALSGLESYLGHRAILIGSFFGLIAIATSFFVLGVGAKHLFHYDFGVPQPLAWVFTVVPPLIIFLYGTQNFIAVLGSVGAVSALVDGSVILLSYLRARRTGERTAEYALRLPSVLVYAVIALLLAGTVAHFIFVP